MKFIATIVDDIIHDGAKANPTKENVAIMYGTWLAVNNAALLSKFSDNYIDDMINFVKQCVVDNESNRDYHISDILAEFVVDKSTILPLYIIDNCDAGNRFNICSKTNNKIIFGTSSLYDRGSYGICGKRATVNITPQLQTNDPDIKKYGDRCKNSNGQYVFPVFSDPDLTYQYVNPADPIETMRVASIYKCAKLPCVAIANNDIVEDIIVKGFFKINNNVVLALTLAYRGVYMKIQPSTRSRYVTFPMRCYPGKTIWHAYSPTPTSMFVIYRSNGKNMGGFRVGVRSGW